MNLEPKPSKTARHDNFDPSARQTMLDFNLINEWCEMDRRAHALQSAVYSASLAALEGRGEPPTQEQRVEARRLRQEADELFSLAMAQNAKAVASRKDEAARRF